MTGPPLARSGVDRAAHRRTDREWLDQAWQEASVLVISPAGRTLCSAEPALVFVSAKDAPDGERLFLGVDLTGTPYFAVVAELPERSGASAVSLREVGALLPDRDAGLFVTAAALVNWHARHPYSPASGQATTVTEAGWLRIDDDGGPVFPRTDPAIIVLVHDGVPGARGRCLLGSNAAWRARSAGRAFFSTLAGFVEPGESAEAAVAREVFEEVGVAVTDVRYVASQAWPFPGSLMLGFTALADPSEPVTVDPAEIAEAGWFTREEISRLLPTQPDPGGAPYGTGVADARIALPGPASIAHYLIRTWVAAG